MEEDTILHRRRAQEGAEGPSLNASESHRLRQPGWPQPAGPSAPKGKKPADQSKQGPIF